MNKNKTTARSFSVLTGITLFEKAIAFVFEAIIAATLGAGIVTDAYFTAAEFFTLVDSAFLSSLTVIVINRFSYHITQEGAEKAFASLSNILSCYLPLMTLTSGLICLFAAPISYVIAPGYDAAARLLLIRCTRLLSVIPVVVCVMSVELAVLRQKKHFGITGLKSLFISVIGIVALVLFGRSDAKNADVLVFAYIISNIAYCVLTTISIRKYGRLRLCKPSFNEEIKITVRKVLPLMVSYGIARVSLMVGKIVASLLGEGHVSNLTYAHTLYRVVAAIFITNLATILLTDFNEMLSQKNYQAVQRKIRAVVPIMTMLLIPITVVSVVCSRDIVKIVYERGNFTSESTVIVANVLMIYALNFIPTMIHGIYNQVLYANGDTKTPMWIAFVTITVNLSISLLLSRVIGLPGVAVGTLISSFVGVLLCSFAVKRFLPGYRGCYSVRFLLCCVVSTVFCVAAAILVELLHLPALWAFVLSTLVCSVSFLCVLLLLREKTAVGVVRQAVEIAKKLIKR